MVKVHVIDGTFELFRAYYAAPSMRTSKGKEVGAARVFARSLNLFLQREDVTHVAAAFDTVIESFRNQLFEGYKTGEGLDPDIYGQFPLVEEACEALGVPAWRMIDFEADDGLAAAADAFKKLKSVEQVVLCTPDKDLMQCVEGRRVVCWDRLRDKTYDAKAVKEKFGILPRSIPDYLALVGDDADGIPGVPRWGAKSTSTLLAEYKHLEKVPMNHEKWKVQLRGAAGLANSLRDHAEDAQLYKTLATLRTDAPIDRRLADIRWRGIDEAALTKFCRRVEMRWKV